jgi:putative tryptophan/tyrosine transport system substrate-binding protein
MRRREFITLMGAAAAWPLAARAQSMLPTIGFLNSRAPGESSRLLEAFHQGLKDRGFVEGHNVKIEYRFAHNQNERLPALATDLVQRQVTAIVSMAGTPGALAAKAATKVIPIVFQAGADMTFCGANVRFMTQSVHWSLRSWDWMTAMLVRRCVWLS